MLYKNAGVDINKAEKALAGIKSDIQKTHNKYVLSEPGYFGAAYQIPESYKNPVLISSIDGVGTKILVAIEAGKFKGLGEDIVNHCVNDILTMGAKPLFLTDYFACGKLDENVITSIVQGITKACKENDCALIGGETAEMPDMYPDELFDLAASITGIVEKDEIIDGHKIKSGDKVYGLKSSGFHTNGYSLIRSVISNIAKLSLDSYIPEMEDTLGEILLRSHRSYYKILCPYLDSITGLVHITGGGFYQNIPRVIPEGLSCHIDIKKWDIPYIFKFFADKGDIPSVEAFNVFNMGIGMIVIAKELDIRVEIGEICCGKEPVVLDGIDAIL